MAQTIAKRHRSVTPQGFRLGLIAMSPLLRPVQPTESVERADREGVLCSKTQAAPILFHSRPQAFVAVLSKNTVGL